MVLVAPIGPCPPQQEPPPSWAVVNEFSVEAQSLDAGFASLGNIF